MVASNVFASGPHRSGVFGHRRRFVRGARAEQARSKRARLDDQRADPEWRHLVRESLREALKRKLGCAIRAKPRRGHLAAHTGHLNDPAATLRSHQGKDLTGQRSRAEEVQFEQRTQLIVGRLLHGTNLGSARIVDEHVNATKPLKRLLDH